ncbi:MAG: hypothetical protein ABEJ94_04355 [Halorientalis sp.]
MTDVQNRSRRRFVAGATVAVIGGIAGCTGNGGDGAGDGNGDDGTDDGGTDDGGTDDGGTDDGTGDTTDSAASMRPETVVRKMLRATAAGDRETVRRLTIEGHSLSGVGKVEQVTIESVERYSARAYAERTGASVSAVEDALRRAENRGYDDATIVSYTASSPRYGEIQRDYILVLDGDRWLMYDFGQLPE